MESLQENLMENRKIRNITVSSFPNILAELIPSTQIRKTPLFKCLMQAFLFSTIFQFGNIQLNELHSREQYGSVFPYTVSLHPESAVADDELAQYAAEGHKVGVDGQCFMRKCALETSSCANDPSANCLKGLSCLARCKGGSMCSTGCFAKYGSEKLDNLLSCSVEKNDCVSVPGKENVGWTVDTLADLPAKPLQSFDIASLKGRWYKVMGLDSRYDCFDCQKNSFEVKDKSTLKMEALFRIPRPTAPGFLQSKIVEELHTASAEKEADFHPQMQSKGQMFGLTFWENWYILSESNPSWQSKLGTPPMALAGDASDTPEMKLVYYTGHTLQGSYKGAFLYSRTPTMSPGMLQLATEVIRKAGLNPNDFCMIRNQCFLSEQSQQAEMFSNAKKSSGSANKFSYSSAAMAATGNDEVGVKEDYPFWYLGQKFFEATKTVAGELADWFEDPAILSDWLLDQQERMVFSQPLAVSPFASLQEN
eukprot:gene24742-33216_t